MMARFLAALRGPDKVSKCPKSRHEEGWEMHRRYTVDGGLMVAVSSECPRHFRKSENLGAFLGGENTPTN